MQFESFLISCPERAAIRAATLRNLGATDWDAPPRVLVDDAPEGTATNERIERNWRRAIACAASSEAPFVLLLEDDLSFCRRLRRAVSTWPPLLQTAPAALFYALLYHPWAPWQPEGLPFLARSPASRALVVAPEVAWGSQAVLMTPATARHLLDHWDEAGGFADVRMPRILGGATRILVHVPSLVDHLPAPSTWGGAAHRALDFSPDYLDAACILRPRRSHAFTPSELARVAGRVRGAGRRAPACAR